MKRFIAISLFLTLFAMSANSQQVSSGHILGNPSASSARATDTSLSAIIDRALCSSQGSILYRNVNEWLCLTAGVSNTYLMSHGAASNPSWVSAVGAIGGFSGILGLSYGLSIVSNNIGIDWSSRHNAIDGCVISVTSSSSSITVSPCKAVSSDDYRMMQSNLVSKTVTSWTLGNAGGCLDAGSFLINTWYALFQIARDTGTPDYVCTKEIAEVMPTPAMVSATYTHSRYIGSFRTNGVSEITKFTQSGETFYYDAPIVDVGVTGPGSSAVLRALTVPLGILTEAILNIVEYSGGSAHIQLTSSVSSTDTTPSISALTINATAPLSAYFNTQARMLTDHSGRIRTRNSTASPEDHTWVYTLGYRDLQRSGQ